MAFDEDIELTSECAPTFILKIRLGFHVSVIIEFGYQPIDNRLYQREIKVERALQEGEGSSWNSSSWLNSLGCERRRNHVG
jgi:hypothetical protein